MPLIAVSKDTIRAYVIRYFHDVFKTPISAFKPGTNVRKAYSYSDRAWRRLADSFNKLSWMDALGAMLSPRAMPGLNTIEDLVNAIWGSLSKIVSVPAGALGSSAIHEFPSPNRPRTGRAHARAPARSSPKKSRPKATRKKATRKKTTRKQKTG